MAKSWRTTAGGVIAALGLICTELGNLFDGNPETVVDWTKLGATVVAAFGVFFAGKSARDRGVSSEAEGIQ